MFPKIRPMFRDYIASVFQRQKNNPIKSATK